ncbi:MAG: hypothetical protein AB1341_14790 [Bacillota bacterium]
MNIELLIMPHVLFGVLGILAALWVAVEGLNISEVNKERLKLASIATTVLIWLSYLFGGYWYVNYYANDKVIIKAGLWKWAHTFFMEAKEHIFFIPLTLSMFLVVIVFNNYKVLANKKVKSLIVIAAISVVILGLGIEGFGAMITKGVKMGLISGGK